MTARPSGAFCSPPSPSPSAIGAMPMIIASAVISTGRKRTKPASSAAAIGIAELVEPFAREADHQHAVGGGDAHAHDGAGQRRHRQRGVGREQHPDDAGERGRQRGDDDERIATTTGSSPRSAGRSARWRRAGRTAARRRRCSWSAPGRAAPPRCPSAHPSRCPRCSLRMSAATAPRSRPCVVAIDLHHRLDVVLRDHRARGSIARDARRCRRATGGSGGAQPPSSAASASALSESIWYCGVCITIE